MDAQEQAAGRVAGLLGFFRSKTSVFVFLCQYGGDIIIVGANAGGEDDVGGMSNFWGVVREFFGGFGNARFARFVISDDEVPRLHIDTGGAVAQGGFDMGEVFGSDFFGRVERFGAVSLADDFGNIHDLLPLYKKRKTDYRKVV